VCTPAQDPDCGGPVGTTPIPGGTGLRGQDHVVITELTCSLASCPTRGAQTVTVEQGGIVFPKPFKVVGEARTVSFFTLEKDLQAGVANNATTGKPDCPLIATLAYFTKSLGEAEKTIIIARALDIDGNPITGAWFNWTIDDTSKAVIASPISPTLDLGSFGFGAPNIICAPASALAGTITVKAQLTRIVA